MSANIFVANALLGTGISIVLYTVLPAQSWLGILLTLFGFGLILNEYRSKLKARGLKPYLPQFIADLLERTDIFDFFVLKLRDNSFVSKMSRLLGMSLTYSIDSSPYSCQVDRFIAP